MLVFNHLGIIFIYYLSIDMATRLKMDEVEQITSIAI